MMLMSRNGELSGRDNRSGNTWARACDACGSSPCRVYCRADGAYLCSGCDARQHAPNSPHERVWVCEGCGRSPAAFLCKADAASLCAACDADVHSANPLASRHHRVHILPLNSPSAADPAGTKRTTTASMGEADNELDEEDEDEAASWLLLNPFDKCSKINNDSNTAATNGYFLGADVDKYLDLVEYTSAAGDAVQLSTVDRDEPHFDILVPNGIPNLGFHLDFDIKSEFGYSTSSTITHTVSSLDAGIVPESTMSEISTANNPPPPKGTIDLFSCSPPLQQMPTQLSPMDREARVMRYREKKKTRKFEKTIRYASRKAYAETRPRIKGRFAKRNDADQNGGYGIVPSF